METQNQQITLDQKNTVITPAELLNHWQGHRRVTRRVIEAFPEKELFNYAIGGMRPFADLAKEMLAMAIPGMKGVVTRSWDKYNDAADIHTKETLLKRWDEATEEINSYWKQIPTGRFQEMDVAFGQWEGRIHQTLSYFIDNEIHHRGQGFVYLRSLGIEPPAFWDRN